MPAPTAQPQRVAVGRRSGGCRRRAAPARPPPARSGASGWRTCSSLRSPIASSSKSFTSAAMRTGKPLASNRLIGAPPLLPASSASQVVATSLPTGVTRPMPVIATRRLAPCHASRPFAAANSSRAVATVLPLAHRARSAMIARLPSVAARASSASSVEHVAGRDERAHLHVGHPRRAPGRVPAGQSVASPRAACARPICASSSSVAGNTGRRGKWSAKNGADAGTCSVARRRLAGHASPCARRRGARRRGSGRAARPRRAAARSAPRSASGESNSSTGSIGPRQSTSSITRCAVDARPAARRRPRRRRSVSISTASSSVSPGATSARKRVSLASAATGRPRKPMCSIATHAASWPTASATRHDGNAAHVRRHRETRRARAARRRTR